MKAVRRFFVWGWMGNPVVVFLSTMVVVFCFIFISFRAVETKGIVLFGFIIWFMIWIAGIAAAGTVGSAVDDSERLGLVSTFLTQPVSRAWLHRVRFKMILIYLLSIWLGGMVSLVIALFFWHRPILEIILPVLPVSALWMGLVASFVLALSRFRLSTPAKILIFIPLVGGGFFIPIVYLSGFGLLVLSLYTYPWGYAILAVVLVPIVLFASFRFSLQGVLKEMDYHAPASMVGVK